MVECRLVSDASAARLSAMIGGSNVLSEGFNVSSIPRTMSTGSSSVEDAEEDGDDCGSG